MKVVEEGVEHPGEVGVIQGGMVMEGVEAEDDGGVHDGGVLEPVEEEGQEEFDLVGVDGRGVESGEDAGEELAADLEEREAIFKRST